MNLAKNNNGAVTTRLAKGSIKNSKVRILFTVLTIALVSSLLMVMVLFNSGLNVKLDRQVSKMQHVIYHELTDKEIENLKEVDEFSYLSFSKMGTGVEYEDKILQPSYWDEVPVIGNPSDMSISKIVSGSYPSKVNEIAVTEDFGKAFSMDVEVGKQVAIEFLNGQKEDFVISGVLENPYPSEILTIALSKEYAESGPQLKDVNYDGAAKIEGGENMNQEEFLELIRNIGENCGIERKNINENNNFVGSLPGDSLKTQQDIVIVIAGIGLLFVSVLVIYSIFYISIVNRIRQIGQLRTIGMTRKQLKNMIIKEGLFLSAIGIPIGLVIGSIAGYFIQPEGWSLVHTIIYALVVAAACLLTVLLSVLKPAKTASKITPIEALKYSGYEIESRKKSTKKLQRKLTSFSLAKISTGRNKKRTMMTIVSLAIGGILFMTAATLVSSTNLEGYSRQSDFRYGEAYINISSNAVNTAENGMTDIQINNPLNQEFINEIKSIDGVKNVYKFQAFDIRWEANGNTGEDRVKSFHDGEIDEKYLDAGSLDYDKMVDNNEVAVYSNELFEEINGWAYKLGDKVKLSFFNGKEDVEREFTVGAFINNDYGHETLESAWFYLPDDSLKEMTGGIDTTVSLSVSTDSSKTDEVNKALDMIVSENPQLNLSTLKEAMSEYQQSFNLIFGVIIGLSLFIIGFSLINLINTLVTNILSRKREFAAIQSIGMTHRQLRKMIVSEGLILALGNIILTLILGTVIGVLGVHLMRNFGALYMSYSFPWLYMIGYAVLITVIPLIISYVSVRAFRRQSLVDRLRIDD